MKTAAKLALINSHIPTFRMKPMWKNLNFLISEKTYCTFFFLLLGLGLSFYFSRGEIIGLDGHSHIGRTWLYKDILLKELTFPIWTNRWYFGYPIGVYYGFLYYLESAIVTMIFKGNIFFGTKIFLWSVHVCSGICMFYFLRLVIQSLAGAIFGATFYVFSFQHIGTILNGGKLPLSLIFLLLPMIFHLFEHYSRKTTSLYKAAPATALLLAATLFTHVQYGFYCLFTFGILATLRFFLPSAENSSRLHLLRYVFLTVMFYTLFILWFIIPAIIDMKELVLSSNDKIGLWGEYSLAKAQSIGKHLFYPTTKNQGDIYYIGPLSLFLIIFSWFRGKCDYPIFLSYLFTFILGTIFLLKTPKYINVWLFFACTLSAYGIQGLFQLLRKVRERYWKFSSLAVILILSVDFGPSFFPKSFKTFDNTPIKAIQGLLEKGEMTGRILVLNKSRSTLWRSLDVVETDASSPFGGIPQTATKTYPYTCAIASQAAMEIYDRKEDLSQTSLDNLALLNICYVWIPSLDKMIKIPQASPVWFSQKIEYAAPTDLENESWSSLRNKFESRTLDSLFLENFLSKIILDKEKKMLKKIMTKDKQIAAKNEDNLTDYPDSPTGCVLESFTETHHHVTATLTCTTGGFVLLPYSYFPYNKVTIDGASVIAYRSTMNFTIVPVPEGKHVLRIDASISHTRKALLVVAAMGVLLSIILLFKEKA